MIIKTAKGTSFECDAVSENPSPPRLYLHIMNASLADVAAAFTDPAALPVEGFPFYDAFQSISMTPYGVNVALKKEGT